MSDNYHGLGAAELPANAPPPKVTPPQGVILTRTGRDGWVRKYLYRAGLGSDQKPWQKSFLISELAPGVVARAPQNMVLEGAVHQGFEPESMAPRESTPLSLVMRNPVVPEPVLSGPPLPPPQAASRLPIRTLESQRMEMPPSAMTKPLPLKLVQRSKPKMIGDGVRMGQAFPIGGGTLPSGQPNFQAQSQPSLLPAAPPPPPPPPETACPSGPMQMPDGRMLNPDDTITLADLCAMIPTIAKALGVQQKKGTMLGPVPMVGQPNGMQTIGGPTSGAGGGGWGGGGGGGGPGIQGSPGLAGPAGAQGATGIGSAFDFVQKTDGDFTAGPGSFIPVPGTLLSFSLPADGSVMFHVQATLGCGQTQNGALGLRIDGSDVPINKRLIHTVVGVDEFFEPASFTYPVMLLAGAHTVEVVLRGLAAGSECSASGLGLSQTVSASPETPLILVAQHSVAGSPAPNAPTFAIDGINKTDGNFTSGSVVPVPGTLVNFTVMTPGNTFIAISGSVVPLVGFVQFWNAVLGIRVDGTTDYILAETSEIQGAGTDRVLTAQLAGSTVIPLVAGAHSVQLLFGNVGVVNQLVLEAAVGHPATLSIIHT